MKVNLQVVLYGSRIWFLDSLKTDCLEKRSRCVSAHAWPTKKCCLQSSSKIYVSPVGSSLPTAKNKLCKRYNQTFFVLRLAHFDKLATGGNSCGFGASIFADHIKAQLNV
jgi:hypothetical protein